MGRKQRKYTYDDWKRAMDLYNRYKLGPTKISRILNISKKTLSNWLYYGVVPPEAKWIAEPNNELGYVIGSLEDGSVYKDEPRHQYVVELGTIDPEFAITHSRMMAKLLNRKYIKPWWNKKRKQWLVVYKSKAFYTWYKRCEEQGLEGFKPYIEYSRETVKHFLRGLYDAEGSNNGNKQIYLTNSKKKLLEYVQYLLEKYFNIKSTGPYRVHKAGDAMIINGVETTLNQDCYRIYIGRKEHVQKYLEEIGFSIVRKQLGLKKNMNISK